MQILIASSLTEIRLVPHTTHTASNNMSASASKQSGPTVPRGLRSLPPASTVSPTSELERLRADSASLEAWWKDARWNQTKRVYSGT